jgi:YVTN family beta-propeller protein
VTVIDGATDRVIGAVTAGKYPGALCYNLTDNKVYCANWYSDCVTVIDGASDSVVATVAVGDFPSALCHNQASNKIYCANEWGSTVTVIDGASDSVIATVAAGDDPWAFCYNPTNNEVYCANISGRNVTVIDGASNEVVVTIGVGSEPTAFAWNPRQNRVYVANYRGSSISVLRDSGGVGIEESFKPRASSSKPAPTLVRGMLFLAERPSSSASTSWLLDISGREVMELRSGANDVRALAPGVYFIREGLGTRGEGLGKTQKVVVTR